MIIVTGSVTAKPGSFEALLEASLAHVHRSRSEDGCISHAVRIDSEEPMKLVFFEEWRDVAALHAHFATPGVQELLTAFREREDHRVRGDQAPAARLAPRQSRVVGRGCSPAGRTRLKRGRSFAATLPARQ